MLKKRQMTLLALTLMAAAAVSVTAVAGGVIIQTFSVSVPPAKAGKAIALNVSETTSESLGPSVQTSPLKRQIIRFHKGGKFNGRKFAHCKKSTLISLSQCPSRTRIGKGQATAVALPVVPIVNAPLTLYNGQRQNRHDTVYIFAIPDIGPNLLTIGELYKQRRSGRFDYALDFKIDDIQTLPGAPNASIASVNVKTPRKYVKKRVRRNGHRRTVKIPLIQAPKRCSHRKWYVQSEFYYANGEKKTVKTSVRCKRR